MRRVIRFLATVGVVAVLEATVVGCQVLRNSGVSALSATHRILEAAGLQFLPVQGTTCHLDRGLDLFGAIDHLE